MENFKDIKKESSLIVRYILFELGGQNENTCRF